MVLADYADFDVWVGGVIVWVPTIRYIGGIRVLFPDVDKERLYYGDLLEMYAKAGGKGLNVVIHYCLPGHTLDNGLKMLNGDEGIRELLRDFKGLSVIPLYFEEKQGPLLVVDTQGNIISTDEQIPRLSFHDDFEPFHNEFDAPILDEAINSPEFDISTSEPANNTNSIHTPPSISENNPDSIHFDGVETSISEEGEGE
ncbi:hypothetical protein Salat_0047500 [Sesamum alatum]|uniref:PB1-like domain-containing protein n=1 Tax=Sesamum alatum TaxID=300844 RepID=A0AAE2CWF4_9LAMI|nr:hypothetical protein Salat_0047500 [Sesamum alatum]